MGIRSAVFDRLFLPESFNHAKKAQTYDFILANGYGRNSFTDREASTIIRPERDKLGNDIAMFEWLQTGNFDPGLPNILLASESLERSGSFGIPIIGQWEIMYALWKEAPDRYRDHIDPLITIWPSMEGYLGTRGFMLESKKIADRQGLRTPFVAAHPEHVQRCFFLARTIFGSVASESLPTTPDWFDKRSVQKWTKRKWVWLSYELRVRIHHRILGWM